MQFRAARSLWMKFLPLRYSIPRAMSVMNLISICDGRYCRTKQTEFLSAAEGARGPLSDWLLPLWDPFHSVFL